MIKTPIHSFLQEYIDKDNIRCHMPGGRGRIFPADITEINGAGSLFDSSGIIAESEKLAAENFGARASLFSAGGSTLCIQAMLSALKKTCTDGKRKKIIAGRYSHRSLISAAVLLGLKIEFVYPDEYLSANIPMGRIAESLKKSDETAGIFLTGIDYYGGMLDVSGVSELTKKLNIPLLIDNAHGAYLAFTDFHPLKQGADMTSDSAHKTLPVLTGGAYLNIAKTAFGMEFEKYAKQEMALFGSTSPSYLILESLDLCNRHLSEEKERAENAFSLVRQLKNSLVQNNYTLKDSDFLRVTINAKAYGYNGFEFAKLLRNNRPTSIECEMCDENYVILLFSTVFEQNEAEKILKIMENIKQKSALKEKIYPVLKPVVKLSPREAYFSKSAVVPLRKAEGRICAEILTQCPPCVPLVMPGEILDKDCIEVLDEYGIKNITVNN